MMTGQPYKSPEAPKEEQEQTKQAEESGTLTSPTSPTASLGAAAMRGVGTMSARLQRQRLANQVYKDAWAATDPSLERALSPAEVEAVAARLGLEVGEGDVEELLGRPDGGRDAGVSCECLRFLLCLRGFASLSCGDGS